MKKLFMLIILVSFCFGFERMSEEDLFKKRIDLLPHKYNSLKTDASKVMKENENSLTLIYLFSSSVPKEGYVKFLQELKNYNSKNSYKLNTSQSLIGIDSNFYDYLQEIIPSIEKHQLEDYVNIQLAPELFEITNSEKVPVLILAECKKTQHPSDCTILSLARGSVSVDTFFKLLKKEKLLPKELQ